MIFLVIYENIGFSFNAYDGKETVESNIFSSRISYFQRRTLIHVDVVQVDFKLGFNIFHVSKMCQFCNKW